MLIPFYRYFTLLSACFFFLGISAQSIIRNPEKHVDIYEINSLLIGAPIRVNNSINSNTILDTLTDSEGNKLSPFTETIVYDLSVDLSKKALKVKINSDTTIWIISICSKTAVSIDLVFSEFYIPKNCKLFLFDKELTYGFLYDQRDNPKVERTNGRTKILSKIVGETTNIVFFDVRKTFRKKAKLCLYQGFHNIR